MDADFNQRRRDQVKSQRLQREKRWSMNSQRLEEIVAELMKPISDVRRSFDTDLSALLEEYLTEAGLHALDASEDDEEGAGAGPAEVPPNFAGLALLLQHSACVYGRKVDFLYQHVLNVSDSLHNASMEIANETEADGEPAGGAAAARGRRGRAPGAAAFAHVALAGAPGAAAFAHVALAGAPGAAREPVPRPPPTLPRAYIELEPRALAPHDFPLTDLAGEPIGLLTDYQVTWRLQGGMLVEELETGVAGTVSVPPIPLVELQRELAAAAPPLPPPASPPSSPPPASPLPAPRGASTPAPPSPALPAPPAPLELKPLTAIVKRERKRKNETKIDDILGGSLKLLISKEARTWLSRPVEFSVCSAWRRRVLTARTAAVLAARRRAASPPRPAEFRGFEDAVAADVGGFAGWPSEPAPAPAPVVDSDDDGFFEQSSLGDSDTSRADETSTWESWVGGVVATATARERCGYDARRLAATLLARLGPEPRHVDTLLARAPDHHHVSRYFLTALFLANAGNVEIVQGPPLTVNSCSLRLLSADEKLVGATLAAEPAPAPATHT